MSKRFGRNQKRTLKAAVSLAEGRQKRAEDEAKRCIRFGEQAKKIIELVGRINPGSVALEHAVELSKRVGYASAGPSFPSLCAVLGDANQAPGMVGVRTIDLYHLETELVANRQFMDAVHFKVRLRSSAGHREFHYGYAASLEAMKARPEIVGDEISRLLKRDLRAH